MQEHFNRHIAGCWLPRARRDSEWGFHQNYDVAWNPLPDTHRALVYHCRMLWLAAVAGDTETVEAAVAELHTKFWDKDYGAYYWRLNLDGKQSVLSKHQYGNAFAIYALAKAGKLEEAMKVFEWVNKFAHDEENGGFFDECSRNGRPRLEGGSDEIKTPYRYKSMNTSLHLMEAFNELYRLGKDATVRKRLAEMLDLYMNSFTTSEGVMYYYLTHNLKPASDIDSYGHAVEAAFLMAEAAEALGENVDAVWERGRAIVDRTLSIAWDQKNGGLFYEGTFTEGVDNSRKYWWAQAENFNVLKHLARRFGGDYARLRDEQWAFIERFQIDEENFGWIADVAADGTRDPNQPKSDGWTEGYHQGRAVLS